MKHKSLPLYQREMTRRSVLGGTAALSLAHRLAAAEPAAGAVRDDGPGRALPVGLLPSGIRERFVENINGLTMHVLEAGFEAPGRPALLLLHGFPDLAYCWRHVMLPLAAAGYHVIAPDQRGYGGTTGWDPAYDGEVALFRTHSYARDALGLAMAMGHRSVATVVGHDVGSAIAAYCALVRPDFFQSVVLMSLPFDGAPDLPFDVADKPRTGGKAVSLQEQLARLPRPRKDSMTYFSTRHANDDMLHAPQGLRDFLRAYFYVKSADFKENRPFPLASSTPEELAKIPTYYIMDLNETMATTVTPNMPSPAMVASSHWLPDAELGVYSTAFGRTGFQGALNWFRCNTGDIGRAELELFSGRTIDIPSAFISGREDWGIYRKPGAIDRMRGGACTQMLAFELIDNAGHWVQQEQPERFSQALLAFLRRSGVAPE